MAFQKPKGSQIDIESVALDISNDSAAIGHIADGVTTDPGATATLNDDYLRRDGTNTMDGVLTMVGGAVVTDPANPSGLAVSFDPTYQDGIALPAPGQVDFVFGGSFNALVIDAAGNLPPGPEVKSLLPIRMNSGGPPPERDIINVNNLGVATINGNINVDVTDIGVSVEPYDPAIQTHLANMAVHRTINDGGAGTTDLWSASKIAAELALKTDTGHTHLAANITDFAAAADARIAAAQIGDLADVTEPGVDPATGWYLGSDGTGGWIVVQVDAGDVATGVFADARISQSSVTQHEAALTITQSQISDLAHTNAYTKTESDGTAGSAGAKTDKVAAAVAGNFAGLDASGNLTDSGSAAASFATAAQGTTADSAVQPGDNVSTLVNDANYQGQVVPGTVGDFAALDISGNIIDGGAQASDFATAAQGTTADSATQPGDNVSTLTNDAGYTTDATVATNHYSKTESDGTAGSAGAKTDKVFGAVAGNFAGLDAAGNLTDSGSAAAAFATAAQGTTADSATQPGDNVSTLTNDASYTTDATVAGNHYTKTEADAVGPAAGAKVDKVAGVSGNVVEFGASNAIADSGVATSALAPLASPTFTGVPVLPSYTLGTLPVGVVGGLIYVSDANTSAGAIAFYNGSNWIDPSTGTTVA